MVQGVRAGRRNRFLKVERAGGHRAAGLGVFRPHHRCAKLRCRAAAWLQHSYGLGSCWHSKRQVHPMHPGNSCTALRPSAAEHAEGEGKEGKEVLPRCHPQPPPLFRDVAPACSSLLPAHHRAECSTSAAHPRPPGPGGGGSMDDTQPLFITFKCIAGNKAGSIQPGQGTTLLQPQSVEQCDAQGRRGGGAAEGPQPQPQPPLAPCHVLQGCSQPGEVAASLRARTKLWFEQTQVHRLGATGNLPAWFHGFISRRDTEQMLQDEPLGCFLVRFSESTVGFVLSYRGRERCRHFVLDQLPNGHYVILGEHSAHPELAELLQHYTHVPIPPYGELLTVPRGQDKACGVMRTPDSSSTSCKAPANHPAYSTMAKQVPGDGQAAESGPEEAPSIPLPLPAKVSSSVATQGPHSRTGSEGAEASSPSTQTHLEANPAEMLDAKYQQLVRFHTYAEPHEGTALPVEPIPFYAMGWGSSPSPEANIYAEVAIVQQEPPPRGARGPGSLLAPTTFLRQRLSRSLSSQGFHRRQLPATPTAGTMQRAAPRPAPEIPLAPMNSALEFDDPVYGPRTSSTKQATAPENVYEQVSRGHP